MLKRTTSTYLNQKNKFTVKLTQNLSAELEYKSNFRTAKGFI